MGRKIRFRAWDKHEKRMIYPEEIRDRKGDLWAIGFHGLPIAVDRDSFKDDEIIGWNIDHRFEIMQFTGIEDRNECDIYEGDIVRVEGTDRGAIEYSGAEFIIRTSDNRIGLNDLTPAFVEVIGNIYEEPELLKEDRESWSKNHRTRHI